MSELEVELSPLMKQYNELKAQAEDALLLFRMGDFYELFGDDAIEASRILEITLTSRDKHKPNPMPMAGVPHHSIHGYLQRLLKAGKKVAISEQFEEAPTGAKKTIVGRKIVRILTPGVQFDGDTVDANYLAALIPSDNEWVLACIDVSTGEALVGDHAPLPEIEIEIAALPIKHLITLGAPKLPQDRYPAEKILIEHLPSNYLSLEQAEASLKTQYDIENLTAFLPTRGATQALGVALHYLLRTQQQKTLAHLQLPQPLHKVHTLALGPKSPQHLDLIPGEDGNPNLFQLINKTKSALGARHLRRWLLAPLKNEKEIAQRQNQVRSFAGKALSEKVSAELSQVYDLERILARVVTRLANPRDTLALGKTLQSLGKISAILDHHQDDTLKPLLKTAQKLNDKLTELGKEIVKNQRDDAPLVSRDGEIFNFGAHPDLDRLITITEHGQKWLIDLETAEREKTQIPTLKVRYNRVFGYYIEITQTHLKNVPAHYQRKQTTVGGERFFTEELKKFEDEIVSAEFKRKSLEQNLFQELLEKIHAQTACLMEAAKLLGEIDTLYSLAKLTEETGWCFPQIDSSLDLEIEQGRHPLVDGSTRGTFVPNDLKLSPATRMTLLITGPNMGGKSTVMRQTALIIILGQMGAPVPATKARWGSFSAVYTRIGAHDSISRGQSTFMVEMSELAHILHHADERSLIILDEIGRGTSTYDGMSVAWATLEWICSKIQARTLFATHYHELTRLSTSLPRLANAHLAVDGARGTHALRFLYKLEDGPTNESFGIHVARIAGIPKQVIDRAWRVLEDLESSSAQPQINNTDQLSLFGSEPAKTPEPAAEILEPNPVLELLEKTDLNELTPIQALNFALKLQEMSRLSVAEIF